MGAAPAAGITPADGMRRPRAGALVLPLAGAALAATALLPREVGWTAVLALVIALGVPHGALDGEIAAPLLRPRFGRAWFGAFALPYLGLAGLVLLGWRGAPEATLAGFLAVSVLHFGGEDAGAGRPWEACVRGGLPVMLPALLHPAATAEIFAAVIRAPLPELPAWWRVAAWAWLAATAAWLARARREPRTVAELTGLGLAFCVLPPLSAFGLYFVCLHAPRHMRALAAHPTKAPAVTGLAEAVRRSLPVSALTLVLGGCLWPLYAGDAGGAAPALLALTLQGLAALTLPHVVLDRIADRPRAGAQSMSSTPSAPP